jgi:Ca-activated chloride channel family protein
MLEFQLPWMALTLPLPLLVFWLVKPYRSRQDAVRVAFFESVAEAAGEAPSEGAVVLRRTFFQWLLAPLMWVALVAALTRPVWVEPPLEKIESARDLLIAVDLSGSMRTQDMRDVEGRPQSRLIAVQEVLDGFIARRKGDRIGLMFFGTAPYLQAPFTLDYELVRELLSQAAVGTPGPQTMLGDAIGLAIKTFEDSPAPQRVLVLLTDGNDTGSKVPVARAASLAGGEGITVHTIGFGNPGSAEEGLFDQEALNDIAEATGGVSFMAGDREALEAVYRQLDELEPQEFETISYRPTHPLYMFPLGLALALFVVMHLIQHLVALVRRLSGGSARVGSEAAHGETHV